jgi:hypothetical protein
MNINVIATKLGYYNHKRRPEGSHFQMKLKDFILKSDVLNPKDKTFFIVDNKEYLAPSWVDVLVDDKPRKAKASKFKDEPQDEFTDEVI